MLELWELGGRDDCRFVKHLFVAHPIGAAPQGLWPSPRTQCRSATRRPLPSAGRTKCRILKDGDRVISDSWTIALYLEQAFAKPADIVREER